jgi:hypothetical protein
VFAYEATGLGSHLFGVVDLTTGAFTPRGDMGQTLNGIGSYNGVVYGGLRFGDVLYRINTSTGALTEVGTGNISYGDFGSTTSGLYGFGTDSNLYSINPHTGAATLIGPTSVPFGGVFGMSSGGDTIYATHDDDHYSLNTATGAGTLIGTATGPIGFGAEVSVGGVLYGGGYNDTTGHPHRRSTP